MGLPMQSQNILGLGIYSYADAARFIGAHPRDLRRWMQGYAYKSRSGESDYSAPLWDGQLSETDIDGLGFRDLVELRFVHTFRSSGVPLFLIRRTIEEARESFDTSYPFTSARFKTDGKRIFMEVIEESGDQSLVDVVKRQNVFGKVISPSLREGIELNLQDEATRWYPMKNSKAIVFDPNRKFGQPILADYDVPTAALIEAVRAEGGDEKRVARMYEVPVAAVRKALQFEKRILAS